MPLPKLEQWQWTAVILCGFGMFKELRVSEPFFTQFVLQYKNITKDELVHDVYPWWTYSYLATLAVVFLVTDFLRYRSMVILEGISYVLCWIIMIWVPGLKALLVVEFLYGLACSTEVAYQTYIYAKVDKVHYKKVTSYTYGALLIGRFLAGLLSQIFVSTKLMNYLELNYFTLAAMSVALIFSLLLPKVDQSIYFYRNDSTKLKFHHRIKKACPILLKYFLNAFGNSDVIRWSVWWIVAQTVHLQALNYIQPMWETIAPYSKKSIYNGAVEAVHTVVSAVVVFGIGYVKLPLKKYGDIFLAITSVASGTFLVLEALTGSIWLAYTYFVLFRIIFNITITVASAEVAQHISEDSHGLIFGINTFAALVLQTILTIVVADRRGLLLSVPVQFTVYGGINILLGLLYVIVAAVNLHLQGISDRSRSPAHVVSEELEKLDMNLEDGHNGNLAKANGSQCGKLSV